MDRRKFLKNAGLAAATLAAVQGFEPWRFSGTLLAEGNGQEEQNKNWADPEQGAIAIASSHISNPYEFPEQFSLARNLFGETVYWGPGNGWETATEEAGAWVEITLPEPRVVRELWILPLPIPDEIHLNPYTQPDVAATPRKIKCSFEGGKSFEAELRQGRYLQILSLPQEVKNQFIAD